LNRIGSFEISRIDPDRSELSSKGNRHDSCRILESLLSFDGSGLSKKLTKMVMIRRISSDICLRYSIYSAADHFDAGLLSTPYPIPFFFLFLDYSLSAGVAGVAGLSLVASP
jgi:hypothetical protein